jgi:hypothetical protein
MDYHDLLSEITTLVPAEWPGIIRTGVMIQR